MSMRRRFPTLIVLLGTVLALNANCAHEPEMYRQKPVKSPTRSAPPDPQVIRGRENVILDGLGHYVLSLPFKLILWNWQVDRHKISDENERELETYIAVNQLETVQVRLNSYAPFEEFGRLKRDKDVHGGYKYTIGILAWLEYTLLPGRLFGGDNYNPYTNTINIYSNHPAILTHEAGHAKDWKLRKHRGTYAFMRVIIPFFAAYQEWVASADAVRFKHCRREDTRELNSYPILFPAWATYIGGYGGPIGYGGAVIVGHVYGRYYRHARRNQLKTEPTDVWLGECWTDAEATLHPAP
jgi:hypothetical protein